MNLYIPFFKSLNTEIKLEELPSLGKFYPKYTKISIIEKPAEQLIHNLLHMYNQSSVDTLSKAKNVLTSTRDLIQTEKVTIDDLVLSDLFYVYTKCCNNFLNLGYWHPTKNLWCPFTENLLQFSRKILTLQTFDPKNKTYKIGEWNVSEPSVRNLSIAFEYLVWRKNIGKTASDRESKYLALIVYTCGNNKMSFSALESVLESFLERNEKEQEELIKMHKTLEDIGLSIVGIYDEMLIPLSSLHPLPKYFN